MELEYWNSINLNIPPFSTYPVSRKTFDVDRLKNLLVEAIKYFHDQKAFNDEIKQISQFLHISKSQFRIMKGYQEMNKTYQAAKKLRRLNIIDILETFNSYVADDFQSEIFLPHRENIEYLLIKLQGLSKILIRIIICSRKSSRYFLGLIRCGSFYIKGTIFVSSLAKVWNMSRQICTFVVNLYNNLIQFRDKLKPAENFKWISNEFILPEMLDVWLGEEYDFFVNNETYESKLLNKSDDIEYFRSKITHVTEKLEKFKTNDVQPENLMPESLANNTVSPIEMVVEDSAPLPRENTDKSIIDYQHSLLSVKTKENVKLFLKFEEKYRKQDVEKSITIKKVSKRAWNELKSDLKNKLLLMHESSMIEYFHDNINHYMEKQ